MIYFLPFNDSYNKRQTNKQTKRPNMAKITLKNHFREYSKITHSITHKLVNHVKIHTTRINQRKGCKI